MFYHIFVINTITVKKDRVFLAHPPCCRNIMQLTIIYRMAQKWATADQYDICQIFLNEVWQRSQRSASVLFTDESPTKEFVQSVSIC